MRGIPAFAFRAATVLALGGALVSSARFAGAQARAETARAKPAFTVDGQVALHSFMALADGHMQKLADALGWAAATGEARSGDWPRIRGRLSDVARANVPAVLWYARPDGGYWTLAQGRAEGSLSDRAYFPRALGGATVLGDLVVSRSSRRNTAIVAVPVRDSSGAVTGVLGASVHLDSLGAIIRDEMALSGGFLFFAIDSTPRGALHSDPSLIFTEPMQLGDEGMKRAFREMLAHEQGTVSYTFRGRPRTLLYRKSPVTGWWYAFGVPR